MAFCKCGVLGWVGPGQRNDYGRCTEAESLAGNAEGNRRISGPVAGYAMLVVSGKLVSVVHMPRHRGDRHNQVAGDKQDPNRP